MLVAFWRCCIYCQICKLCGCKIIFPTCFVAFDKTLFSIAVCAGLTLCEMAARSNKLMKSLSIYVFVSQCALCPPAFIKDFTCPADSAESLDAIPPNPQQGRCGSRYLSLFIYAFLMPISGIMSGAWKRETLSTLNKLWASKILKLMQMRIFWTGLQHWP